MSGPLMLSPDATISGVCAGIAESMDLDVRMVRLFALVGFFFMPFAFLLFYGIMATNLPKREADQLQPEPAVALDWEADALKVGWKGPTAPHVVTWFQTFLASFGTGTALFVSGLLMAAALAGGGMMDGAMAVFQMMFALAPFSGFLVLVMSVIDRPYGVRVTHDRMEVERPLKGTRTLALSDVMELEEQPKGLVLRLEDGEELRLPRAPDEAVVPMLQEEIRRGRQRMLDHEEDLGQAEEQRRRVQQLASKAER